MPIIDRGRRLFSVAVVSDTHLHPGGDRDGDGDGDRDGDIDGDRDRGNSPFAVNRRANDRLRYVIGDLNRRDVDLVIHLGDIVHPLPSRPALYAESARRFFEITASLRHPLHVIPGNHDVGDKPLAWGPAAGVREEFLQAWSAHFGAHYFHRAHRGVHFIGINAQLPGSNLALEREQKTWLEELLDGLRGRRIFMHAHYPPYLLDPDEAEHYDNLGPAARAWLLALLRRHRVEALFCGHVHQYWFNRHGCTACYLLPSTAFTRQDYSEMFRIAGADQYGRDDAQKLGYMLVHIYARGHAVEVVRSGGRELDDATPGRESAPGKRIAPTRLEAPADAVNFHSRLGFNPRHDWFETVQIPPSGALDEFDRKSARNDYGLLAFLDMGVRRLRLPLADLASRARRRRLQDLQHLGFRYRFHSYHAPAESVRALIRDCPGLVSEWEICCRPQDLEHLDQTFFHFAGEHGIGMVFSPLRAHSNTAYFHVIEHGFALRDAADATLDEWLSGAHAAAFAKYVLRLRFDESLDDAVAIAQQQFERFGKPAVIQLRLAANNPAQNHDDEVWLCRRLAAAAVLGHSHAGVEVCCDSFADADRGYFPHAGVVDRRYNPRPALRLLRHLHGLLAGVPEGRALPRGDVDGAAVFDLSAASQRVLLCLPDGAFRLNRLRRQKAIAGRRIADGAEWRFADLASGAVLNLAARLDAEPDGETALPFALLAAR
ncbi:MAG: metallophosphoesterase [Gammaproteobacteria bacterium]|nr:metallophosphoesterase [Gammaproteobacteria bacterium]